MQGSRGCGASASLLLLPTLTARSQLMISSVPKCCRRCRRPLSSCSHHLCANLPNARIVRGGEHGIFVRGYEDRPSMKGCSLGMILRCVRATRAIARDICPTLPARRDDRSRFTVERYADVPAVLERVTRFAPDKNGCSETTRVRAPIYSARSCGGGGSRKRYTRMDGSPASRGDEMSFYRTP